MKVSRKVRRAQRPQSVMDGVRQFLTPQVWKQVRQAGRPARRLPRWDLQPLVLMLLLMTFSAGDSQAEQFETARGFYVSCYVGRKRPGKTLAGLQKALARVSTRQLRVLAQGVRDQIVARYGERLRIHGWAPLGCDGSRVECPRTAELEARLGQAGKEDSAPTVWLTAFVHLGLGLLWSWRLGKGTADERVHLRQMLALLPAQALIVADAAYMGYELARAVLGAERQFLWRLCSRVDLYTPAQAVLETWEEGLVYYWPQYAQQKGLPPVAGRLIRVRGREVKRDVWLLTSVLDAAQLSRETAALFYRWRWRNEGLFRTYKRTVRKLKFSSRTVALVHREAEVSLLALQVLLAHADLALRQPGTEGEVVVSPRKVQLAIRHELHACSGRRADYARRLAGCGVTPRQQTSPKARRVWPRRKPHQPPKPPRLHTLTARQITLLQSHLDQQSQVVG